MKKQTIQYQKGNALIIVMLLFVVISLSVSVGLVSPTVSSIRSVKDHLESARSYAVAESGVEDVYYRLLVGKNVSSSETITIGSQQSVTTLTDISGGTKQIQALGDSNDRNRTVTLTVSQGEGVSFNYGVQVGQGGMTLTGSSGINGSVYASGDIQGTSSSFITGSALSANSAALAADQSNSTGTVTNVSFGNTNSTQDMAQSFTVSTESPLHNVELYLRKVGTPANGTIYIMSDNGGIPSTVTLAQAPLSASSVGAGPTLGWVQSIFTTNPTLQTGVTYWLVVDVATNPSNYYVTGTNTNGYANGSSKIGQRGGTWNNSSPATLDYYFKVSIGGQTGRIFGSSLSQWNQLRVGTGGTGTASAQTVDYVTATGTIYCQTGTGNNKVCNTSQPAPTEQAWPVSDSNIQSWKDDAVEQGGITNGDVTLGGSSTQSIGPRKIVGNMTVGGSGIMTVTGTLWITGNLTVNGSGILKLASTYGSSSGVIVVDGRVTIAGSSPVNGSGTSGSYIMITSLSDCPVSSSCSGANAIDISGSAGAVVLVAQNGTINFSGSASAKQATGYAINLSGSTVVTYESGLANMNFTSGPSGSWNVDSWQEE